MSLRRAADYILLRAAFGKYPPAGQEIFLFKGSHGYGEAIRVL
jgi:hypothetical protein